MQTRRLPSCFDACGRIASSVSYQGACSRSWAGWYRHCKRPHQSHSLAVGAPCGRNCAQGMSRSERRRPDESTNTIMQLASELDNFQELARSFIPTPGDIPNVNGIDIFGGTLALSGSVGGDLIVYLDFKQLFDLDARIQHALDAGRSDVVENLRACQCKAGIAVVDVSGHRVTDAF